MPGMHNGVDTSNSILVTAFRAALMHQGLAILLVFFALASAWIGVREWQPAAVRRAMLVPSLPEPAARAVLRIGFGLLWVLDGILQAQPAMAAGLPGQVVAPEAATAPGWVKDVISWSGTGWTYHPVQAAAATVWIQAGLGIWLLAAASGRSSRLAGLVSAVWSVVVWVFGEVFGGLFTSGQSLLLGAPGAVAFYFVAGWLIARPDRTWQSPVTGRRLLTGLGVLLGAMAVLQAWPGRGFWQGTIAGRPGPLTDMISSMAGLSQPAVLARLSATAASVAASHGFWVNALAVTTLAILSLGLLVARGRLLRAVVIATAVFCLAVWLLVQDLGVFGGLGTDPNNMVPLLLLVVAGYVGVTRIPPAEPAAGTASAWRDQLRPGRLARGFASLRATGVVAVWAIVVVAAGAAPLAMAQVNPVADPIIARAIDGASPPTDTPAAPFQLTSSSGQAVSLASLRGTVVLLTFLDPVSTRVGPVIAQELRTADELLGADASSVDLVAIASNPRDYEASYLGAFDRREGLASVANWSFLTGSLSQLRSAWSAYGVGAGDLVLVIDRAGRVRARLDANPGPATASSKSSFAAEFAQAAQRALTATDAPA